MNRSKIGALAIDLLTGLSSTLLLLLSLVLVHTIKSTNAAAAIGLAVIFLALWRET